MKMSYAELMEILDKHIKWLSDDQDGVRANLRGANLRGVNLCGANLSGADLRGADLRGANLCRANLCGANLYESDLYGADLSGANLSGADLHGVNLCGANLCGANLYESDLRGVNLCGANLYESDLYGADLHGANLCEANLSGADLRGAINVPFIPMVCPEEGSFIGFKKCRDDLIVKLEITEDALRCSATSRKCRCSKAKVLSITNIDGSPSLVKSVPSKIDPDFIYTVGETVEVQYFDIDRWNECSAGIHFFINRQEAVDYID